MAAPRGQRPLPRHHPAGALAADGRHRGLRGGRGRPGQGDLTLHEWAAGMRRQKLAPDIRKLVGPEGFYQSRPRARLHPGRLLPALARRHPRAREAARPLRPRRLRGHVWPAPGRARHRVGEAPGRAPPGRGHRQPRLPALSHRQPLHPLVRPRGGPPPGGGPRLPRQRARARAGALPARRPAPAPGALLPPRPGHGARAAGAPRGRHGRARHARHPGEGPARPGGRGGARPGEPRHASGPRGPGARLPRARALPLAQAPR